MRSLSIALTVVSLVAAPGAAAPTCENIRGETVRCGTDGAMPVGWAPSAREREKLRPEPTNEPGVMKLLQTLCALGVFFSLLALMPDFDGSRAGDWDRQEDESHQRR